jgi:uncharacterized membrane protein
MKRIVSYFFQGLLLVVPLVLTVYLIYNTFVIIDDLLPFHPFPGAGVIIILVAITVIGVLGNTFIVRKMRELMHSIIHKLPLLRTIYTAIKDLLSAFVGEKRKFDLPVLVRMSQDSTIQKVGFITQSDLTSLGMSGKKVAVYLPHSYAFSGNLVIVDRQFVTPIKAPSSEVMKFIVSGGVAIPGSFVAEYEDD